ncbi:MAG TPA: hypothetical protein VFA81_08045 [Burkholderiales bacterium]|nr:hypothetical protein [Burkholderiales bacterium]
MAALDNVDPFAEYIAGKAADNLFDRFSLADARLKRAPCNFSLHHHNSFLTVNKKACR